MRFPTKSRRAHVDWRPPVGALVCTTHDDELSEIVAHFRGDGYGDCLVLKREIGGRPVTRVVTESEWFRVGYVVIV
jgi:hypothetical protein